LKSTLINFSLSSPSKPDDKVVKIAFWLVKSYDFTSQNMLYVLNRLKKSKMDENGLKLGEIGWSRAKSWFQDRFHDCNKTHALKQNVPPSSSCQVPIGCGNAQSRLTWSSLQSQKRSSLFSLHSSFSPNKSLIPFSN
jgi:hypothetical protein